MAARHRVGRARIVLYLQQIGSRVVTSEEATIIAFGALEHVAGDARLLDGFLHESGLTPDALRRSAAEPELLAGVLDFLLGREAALLDFCQARGLPPEAPAAARRALPGGDVERG